MTMPNAPSQTIILWGARGGVGTTVAAIQLAFQHPRLVTLVDLNEPTGRTTAEVLAAAIVQIGPRVSLIPYGDPDGPQALGDGPLADLAEWIREQPGVVIVDAGTGPPPSTLTEVADESIAVTRLSRIDAQHLRSLPAPPTALIVVQHPDAWLAKDDIVNSAHAGIYATMPHDPRVGQAIDTGTFLQRQSRLSELNAMPDVGEPIWFDWPDESYETTVERYYSEEFDGYEDGFESARGDCIHVGDVIWTEKYADRQWTQTLGHALRFDPPDVDRDGRIAQLMKNPRRPDRGGEPLGTWISHHGERSTSTSDTPGSPAEASTGGA
ncbi:MAG: hypothetical protein ACE37B_01455 [Ilumatobacter sp.]|uniref:hypothetical protein n=1 Tax=Ilumatobacter sp. TaxID=1967498 RepID=UPI0039187795